MFRSTASPAFVAGAPVVAGRSAFASRAACSLSASSFAPRAAPAAPSAAAAALWRMVVGVLFSTTTGNTEEVAAMVADALGGGAEAKEIDDVDTDEIAGYDHIVVGAPTWNTGADSDRSGTGMDDFMNDTLPGLDLSGKKVAVFGCGDAVGYADNFCDAIDEVHDKFVASGAEAVGYTPVDATGIEFDESKSVRGDVFVGLPIDNVNAPDETEGKVAAWVEQISGEMGL